MPCKLERVATTCKNRSCNCTERWLVRRRLSQTGFWALNLIKPGHASLILVRDCSSTAALPERTWQSKDSPNQTWGSHVILELDPRQQFRTVFFLTQSQWWNTSELVSQWLHQPSRRATPLRSAAPWRHTWRADEHEFGASWRLRDRFLNGNLPSHIKLTK